MPNFLEQWFDPTVDASSFDPETYAQEKRDMLITHAAVGTHAYAIPRRLGGEATPVDLSQDKRFAKKFTNRYVMILQLWDGHPADVTEAVDSDAQGGDSDYSSIAATVDWHEYAKQIVRQVRDDLKLVAAYGLKEGNRKVANKFANRLLNEIVQLNQVYTEIFPEKGQIRP